MFKVVLLILYTTASHHIYFYDDAACDQVKREIEETGKAELVECFPLEVPLLQPEITKMKPGRKPQ